MQDTSAQPDRRPGPDDQAELDHHADRLAEIVCANCVTVNRPFNHFCDRCGLPLTAYATIGPLEQVYTLGHGYREATTRPTRPILLIGLWLIFGPPLPLLIYGAFQQLATLLFGTSAHGRFIVPMSSDTGRLGAAGLVPVDEVVNATHPAMAWAGLVLLTMLIVVHVMILYKATSRAWRYGAEAKAASAGDA